MKAQKTLTLLFWVSLIVTIILRYTHKDYDLMVAISDLETTMFLIASIMYKEPKGE